MSYEEPVSCDKIGVCAILYDFDFPKAMRSLGKVGFETMEYEFRSYEDEGGESVGEHVRAFFKHRSRSRWTKQFLEKVAEAGYEVERAEEARMTIQRVGTTHQLEYGEDAIELASNYRIALPSADEEDEWFF